MKFWLSHLPLEVWVDVYRYPWISREELGRIVDRFRSRKYAEYLQFYLHDWGKRKLKRIVFSKDWVEPPVMIPQTPLPMNIKSFGLICISHFDQQTIDFLRRMQPLLKDVKFEFDDRISDSDNLRAILDHMVPLLDGNHSLGCNVSELPTVQQCFGDKLAQIKMLDVSYHCWNKARQQTTINFLMNWLPAQDGVGTKLCHLWLWLGNDIGVPMQIFFAIRQEFLAAKHPSTFAVSIHVYNSIGQFPEFHLQNNIGEELHGMRIGQEDFNVEIQITRHPANCGNKLQEIINEMKKNVWKRGKIQIYDPTIGSMDAPENEEADQQPSTSKKA